jgi:hypothetical protein
MLHAVSEYCQDRDDPSELLTYDQIGSLVGDEYQLEQVYLFKQLVDEGLIDATTYSSVTGGLPFSHAQISGLTKAGYQFISEMSRDQDELIAKLDEVISALGRLEPAKRKRGEKIIGALKLFLRSLSHQEARTVIQHLIQSLQG